ncbi:murein hydrolase activator EnvC family protein [Tenuibacillus multivorans]|uniref:Peptidase family M23 n=1 Tax=Tenuibacillus multivorans TaxID=237069 RepID=A0A1H0DKC4_9BACI|nr:peptidoglycan DD-metalloendopeptidase family protein [Tenuibacillus multivorans]GEL76519.1 peptidase M24 [Tenuibacillus multivorans]SDN70508.1 Peptidase family M23 [Tenuibacillus multivorans]
MLKKAAGILAIAVLAFTAFFFTNEDESVEASKSVDEIEQELEQIDQEKQNINSELQNLNDRMQQVRSEKDQAENKLANISYQIKQTETEIRLKELEIDETETEIESLKQQISELEDEIKTLEDQIATLEQEIKETQERIDRREDILVDRLRNLQRNGGSVKYLEVILGAKDFGEFISRTSAVNKIMDQDQKIIKDHFADKEKLEDDKQMVEEAKTSVVTKKEDVEDTKLQMEDKRQTLLAKKNELDTLRADLGVQKEEQVVVLASLEDQVNELHNIQLSKEEELQLIKQRERYLEQAKKVANGDGFLTPTTGRISSQFNPNRLHPIYKVPRPHNGLDIANSRGTSISAAAPGVVYKVYNWCARGDMSCGGGFGNAVFITHYIDGKQYDTVYAHLSSVTVSEGQSVSAGQQIGKMGSTGSSTGDHLHFEVHPGGYKNPVNPLNYINP